MVLLNKYLMYKFFSNSSYSASKARGENFLRAWGETFGLNYIIVNPSNNFGQFQDKFL